MQTKFGDTVRVHFTCKLDDGTTFDSSVGKEPLELTIGDDSAIPGFERALIGMQPGEKKTFRVLADEGYGPHDAEKVKTIPREEFPLQPEVGLKFKIQQSDGKENYITVTRFDESYVTLDANYPLAGKDLIFDIELIDIVISGPSAESYFNFGVMLQDRNEFDEAISFYIKTIKIKPNFVEAYYNLGVAYQEKGLLNEAIACYQQVLEMNPNHEKASINLGISLKETGQYEEAAEHFEKALQIKPDYDIAYYNLGNISYFSGRFEEARQFYERAVSINPQYAEAHWNIALINLLLGNYKEGWKGYDWRLKIEDHSYQDSCFSQPLWDGSSLQEKSLLVYAEQGVGDEIMLASCITDIIFQSDNCIVECDKRLVQLFSRSFPGAMFFERIGPDNTCPPEASKADIKIAMGSLPKFFRPDISSFSRNKSYLFPEPQRLAIWQKRFHELGKGLKVGISWRGGRYHYIRKMRSIPLEKWEKLFALSEVNFINLQYGDCATELNEAKEHLGITIYDWEDADPLRDLDNFAAEIAALDLVVSVDNATVHMAGALGIPTWTLLHFSPDWRWMLSREDSRWYPTLRLFRQQTQGDWEPVLERVREELETLINNFKK